MHRYKRLYSIFEIVETTRKNLQQKLDSDQKSDVLPFNLYELYALSLFVVQNSYFDALLNWKGILARHHNLRINQDLNLITRICIIDRMPEEEKFDKNFAKKVADIVDTVFDNSIFQYEQVHSKLAHFTKSSRIKDIITNVFDRQNFLKEIATQFLNNAIIEPGFSKSASKRSLELLISSCYHASYDRLCIEILKINNVANRFWHALLRLITGTSAPSKMERLRLLVILRSPWSDLPGDTLRNIANCFEEHIHDFRKFIAISERYALVRCNFVPLSETTEDVELQFLLFAETLYKQARFLQDQHLRLEVPAKSLLPDAKALYRMSIIICPEYIPALYQLARICANLERKYESARTYCHDALAIITSLRSIPDDKKTHIEKTIENFGDMLSGEIEMLLTEIRELLGFQN